MIKHYIVLGPGYYIVCKFMVVSYCTVLCCAVLYCTVLYCILKLYCFCMNYNLMKILVKAILLITNDITNPFRQSAQSPRECLKINYLCIVDGLMNIKYIYLS